MNLAVRAGAFDAAPGLIEIGGEAATCDPRGALHFPALDLLVVSDLHLEKGAAGARRGRLLPPYDTAATLDALEAVLAERRPRTVISLGDSFHDTRGSDEMPDIYRSRLAAMAAGRVWIWVTGNHDPHPPSGLPGEMADEVTIGGLRFRHEPQPGAARGEIAGHLHPGAVIVQRGRAVRRRCFATDGDRLIMPAFGAYTGMLNVLDKAYRGLFRQETLTAHMLGAGRVYAIARSRLRGG